MARTSLATKSIALLLPFAIHFATFAGGGGDHSHGPAEGGHGNQVVGLFVIAVVAGGVIWFLSNKKK